MEAAKTIQRPGRVEDPPPMKDLQVSVVIPAYNEEHAVAGVIARIQKALDATGLEYELLVVDDGSSDQTALAAESAGASVVRHTGNRGYGAALKTGIMSAKYDIICITDADGTYPPERIPDLLAALPSADMVVGARIGASVAIPLIRKPAKWFLNQLANYVTQYRIPDLNSGLRVFHRDAALQYFHILPEQFSFTTTLTMAMHCDKYAVSYVPIDYGRRTGRSKIVPWDAVNFTTLILRMAMLFRPLRVFVPCALICGTYAFVKIIRDLILDGHVSMTGAIAALSGLQILLIGMLGEALATSLWHLSGTRYVGVQSYRGRPKSTG